MQKLCRFHSTPTTVCIIASILQMMKLGCREAQRLSFEFKPISSIHKFLPLHCAHRLQCYISELRFSAFPALPHCLHSKASPSVTPQISHEDSSPKRLRGGRVPTSAPRCREAHPSELGGDACLIEAPQKFSTVLQAT